MKSAPFDWNRFHAYRVFDEFLERFVLQRKSYVTNHKKQLDLEAAFEDIEQRFIAAYDASDSSFEDKVTLQFSGAAEQTKIVFANLEYLWAMPIGNITPATKRSYALRWFSTTGRVVNGDRHFFGDPHIIANPGSWYLMNKYWELVAAMRIFNLVIREPSLTNLKELKLKIAEICHAAIYKGVPAKERFAAPNICGIHSALMHLAKPERYESIISASHRKQICAVFGHIAENPSTDTEVLLKQIRKALFDSHGNGEDQDAKYRWFFYSKDVLPLWRDKKTKKQQRVSSALFDVRVEEDAADLEGDKEEIKGYRIRRSAKLVRAAKRRDRHTCQACEFHFEDQIVQVHHLDPLSEYMHPKKTKLADLVTLCPTCHYLAHYWLRTHPKFKCLELLLVALKRD